MEGCHLPVRSGRYNLHLLYPEFRGLQMLLYTQTASSTEVTCTPARFRGLQAKVCSLYALVGRNYDGFPDLGDFKATIQ